jgi:PAS domain S-box-containing protein
MSEKARPDDCDILDFKVDTPYFQALYNTPIPIFIVQEDGRFLLINRAVQRAIGFSPQELPTIEAWAKHTQGDSAAQTDLFFSGLFEPGKTTNPMRVSVRAKDGSSLIWEISKAPIGLTADGQHVVIGIASDVTEKADHDRHLVAAMSQLEHEVSRRTRDLNTTIVALENEIAERKRMTDALALSRERLKIISKRSLNVLEADRRTISKELHDSIGASLAAIKFSLEDKEIKRTRNHGQLDESLEQEIAYLIEAIKETKRIAANLRPTILDDLGLMATIKWYLRQFGRLYGNLRIDYKSEITETDVPEDMKIIIYRILQEGLNNAEKHSGAAMIRLHLGFTDGKRSVSLSIDDDGRGFDVEETLSKKDPLVGYGLIAMRERCEIYGGSFHIESQIGVGTKINAILPI